MPSHLLGLKLYGPYVPLSLAGFLSVWFNRGRAFLALLCLVAAYLLYGALVGGDIASQLTGRVYTRER